MLLRRERRGVTEQGVAEVDEGLAQLGADEGGRGDAVNEELAEILAEAATEVEEERRGRRGGRLAQKGEDAWVGRVRGEGEVQEAVSADAWVRVDGPGALSLEETKREFDS